MINKLIKIVCVASLINIFTPLNVRAATAEISFNDNTIIVNATDIKEGDTILWSDERYSTTLNDKEAVVYKNGIWEFNFLHQTDSISFTLNPTGRFRENTEVIIFGQYFLMAEPNDPLSSIRGDINGDRKHNVADLVLMEQFIHGQSQSTYIESGRSDMTKDGIVDSFDLVEIRKLIINARKRNA